MYFRYTCTLDVNCEKNIPYHDEINRCNNILIWNWPFQVKVLSSTRYDCENTNSYIKVWQMFKTNEINNEQTIPSAIHGFIQR